MATLFDPSKWTPMLGRFLQGQIGGAEACDCEVTFPLFRDQKLALRVKHDEPSRTSVVLDLLCTSVEAQSHSCYTLQLGKPAELLNDQAVCDALMSRNSVSDQG
jgi:hypothetical protein